MRLSDLMELVRTAEDLVSYDTGLGREHGTVDVEHYRRLPPQEFGAFLEEVHGLVCGVIRLKETDL